MRTVTLNNGVRMPILGFGVYRITDSVQCEKSVLQALDAGYRLIDTAAAYLNEGAVGRAMARSGVDRKNLFVTTKLWIQNSGRDAKKAFYASLRKLRLDYLDMYLIHQPYGDVHGCWRAMEELYREGHIRAIGVSNFHPDRVMDLMVHNDIVPAVNQIEMHPFCQQVEAAAFLRDNGIRVQSWGSLAQGGDALFNNPVLRTMAAGHGKSVAQVVLRWLTQQDVVVIPKSEHRERLEENLDIFDFRLGSRDMEAMAALDLGRTFFRDHRDPETARLLGTRKLVG